ncbi:FG-GAP-like repeat-containing protein [Leucobacter sp. NPDC077196]|uniref:FG-GAP-like repeat-containing protein n=1 Tax=Leucobacter sp. NPDC077196 TaxID=3154959 RepID=UPI0034235EF9
MGSAVQSARGATRLARLRRASALVLATAVMLSLPAVTPATSAEAVGAAPVRAEAEVSADVDPTTQTPSEGETAADAAGDAAAADGSAAGGSDGGPDAAAGATNDADAAATGDADTGVGAAADASGSGGTNADATASGTASGTGADASSTAGADGADEAAGAQADAAGPRGTNGGIASDSPWPEDHPAPERETSLDAHSLTARALIGDNYPAKYRNMPWPNDPRYIWDEWNFAYRQCTSFVAWRLNSANGVPFSNQYMGLWAWGNAGEWGDSARSVGIRVDTTPEVGAVAWSGAYYRDASQFGHVAWVADVLSNGNIVIEEYNYGWGGSYNMRVVHPSQFQGYIHIKDIRKRFSTTRPTVSGTPMVGGTLRATATGWSPSPTTKQYQWMRDGAAISGATKSTYQPTLRDLDSELRVEVTGHRTGYESAVKNSVSVGTILMTDSTGSGVSDIQELLPWNSDVNGDGRPDAVGFSSRGVQVSLSTSSGMSAPQTWIAGFGSADGWSSRHHPRTLADVNGDGRADVVGFARDGVYVSTSTGSGFSAPSRWVPGFGSANGWVVEGHPRTLADVNGDGIPDIVGFASDGVFVALGTGRSFAPAARWSTAFGANAGWRTDRHERWLQDMNGDGLADVVGISNAGVRVALSTGTGFSASQAWSDGFGRNAGWRPESHPRMLADVTGDGRPDLVGFASDGVYVATNTGSGLNSAKRWSSRFGTATGWLVGDHPRTLADVDGDGRADVVGFAEDGTYVARSSGSSYGSWSRWTTEFNAKDWKTPRHARVVTDVTGNGKADLVGFGEEGVVIAASTGSRFGAARLQVAKMGRGATAGGWSIASHPRHLGVQRLSRPSTPTISGQAQVGSTLTASVAPLQPAPVRVTYQWRRDGVSIPGATSRTFRPTRTDAGSTIAVVVTGTKFGYARSAKRSASTAKVIIGTLTSSAPRITGTAKVGQRLSATPRNWNVTPDRVTYQWMRDGKAIAGATESMYTLKVPDRQTRITVVVTGTKTNYASAPRSSAATARVGSGSLVSVPPTITGDAAIGRKLTAQRGDWSPSVTFSYQWYRDGKAISGATKRSYTTASKDWKHRLTVRVRGAKTGYFTATEMSEPTARIRKS